MARRTIGVLPCLVCISIARRLNNVSPDEAESPSFHPLYQLKHSRRSGEVLNRLEPLASLLRAFNGPVSQQRCRYAHPHANCGANRRSPASPTMQVAAAPTGDATMQVPETPAALLRLNERRSKAAERRSWSRGMTKQVMFFAIPALSTCLADPLMSVVDATCCGRFSTTLQLASLGPALAVFTFLSYLFFFLNTATADQVSKALANNDKGAATTAQSNALFVAASFGIAIAALLWIFAAPLVALTGCVPELIPTAAAYTRIRGLGQPIVLASMVLTAGLLAQRDSVTPLHAVAFTCLVNIVGDFLLVPKIGAVGAAWATLASQMLALPLLVFLSRRRQRLPVKLRLPDAKSLRPLVSASGPLMLFEMGMSVGYVMIQSLGTQFTVASTAAFQAIWSPLSFIGFSAFPLKQAAQVFLPGVLKEEPRTVGGRSKTYEFFKLLTLLASVYGVLITAASAACAGLPALLTQDAMLWPMIKSFTPLVSVAMALLPFAIAFEGVLLGMGDLKFLAKCQFLNIVTAIATFCITKRAGMGVHGTWVVLIAFYFSRFWQAAARILTNRKAFRMPLKTAEQTPEKIPEKTPVETEVIRDVIRSVEPSNSTFSLNSTLIIREMNTSLA